MSALRVFCDQDNNWVAQTDTEPKPVQVLGIEQAQEFRSLGLHPDGGLCIRVNGRGIIEEVLLINGAPVREFHIPPAHALSRSLQVG